MYHFRYISFKLFVLLLVMPIELVGVILASFGSALQALSQAIGEGLFVHVVGALPENQDIRKLVDLPPPSTPSNDDDE